MQNQTNVDLILDEIYNKVKDGSLKLAKDFGVDAPECATLIGQAMLIQEQRESKVLLRDIRHVLLQLIAENMGKKPSASWEQRLAEKMDQKG